jgi:hypothetical protein
VLRHAIWCRCACNLVQVRCEDAKLRGEDAKLGGEDAKLGGEDAKLRGEDAKLGGSEQRAHQQGLRCCLLDDQRGQRPIDADHAVLSQSAQRLPVEQVGGRGRQPA